MDLTTNNYSEDSTFFASQLGATLDVNNGFCNKIAKKPFLDTFADHPLCKLNLKETSEFVRSFPAAENRGFLEISTQRSGAENGTVNSVAKRNVEPPTPGRPIFSFSNGNFTRKSFPSKWDDAEKWVVSGHDSPAHNNHGLLKPMFSRQCSGYKPHLGAQKSKVAEDKVSKTFQGSFLLDHHNSARLTIKGVSEDALLKDKFPNPKFGCSEPTQEGFLFGNAVEKSVNGKLSHMMVHEVKHKDVGTEMTPLGSSTTSRCPTPFISTSPARHNTPSNRSGPLALGSTDSSSSTMDITQLQDCHLAKLHVGSQFYSVTSNWSSREEEEEDVSKSLRHFEMNSECRKSVSGSRSCTREEEEKTKSCLRYQREEAKIQAWVNHQSAKAEAESRKLEVKIQKMRSNLEEKLMKRMADVHRKAEEWRASAQFQHSEQILKAGQQARKMVMNNKNNSSHYKSCGCFPCTSRHV